MRETERAFVDVVVVATGGADGVRQSVDAALATGGDASRVVVAPVVGGSPALAGLLGDLAGRGDPRLHVLDTAGSGRVTAANLAIADSRNDVVLLAAGASLPEGWLERLRRAASGEWVATATTFSNLAGVCSFPRFFHDEPAAGPSDIARLQRAVAEAALPTHPEIPAGGGACFYVRREAIDAVGGLDVDLAPEASEQADLCLRAARSGWKSVLADDVLVVAARGAPVQPRPGGGEALWLREAPWRRQIDLRDRYPAYNEEIERYAAADPLRPLRELPRSRLARALPLPGILHVTHHHGGGTESHIRALIGATRAQCRHFLAVVQGDRWSIEEHRPEGSVATWAFERDLDEDWGAFFDGIRTLLGIALVHLHNISGSREAIARGIAKAGIPFGYTIHDLSFACPTITLMDDTGRYCGARTDPAVCQSCLAAQPAFAHHDIRAWRRLHADLAASAAFVVAPSKWAAETFRSYFPRSDVAVIGHATPGRSSSRTSRPSLAIVMPDDDVPVVAMLGAIGPDKGARTIERLAELARERDAAVRFVVIGYLDVEHGPWQADDHRLVVHGRYECTHLAELLRHYRASLVLFPSTGPETFCFTLSEAWRAGLPALVPPVGALAERVAATGAGWILSERAWLDPDRMLERVLELSGDDDAATRERAERAARAASVVEASPEAAAGAVLALYARTLSQEPTLAGPSAHPSITYSPLDVLDALGYRSWIAPPSLRAVSGPVPATRGLWRRVISKTSALRRRVDLLRRTGAAKAAAGSPPRSTPRW